MKPQLIITGASKGIGQATAKLFLQNEWDVLNISRSPCPLENIENIKLDLENIEGSLAQLDPVKKRLDKKKIVCLIHNAACLKKDSIDSLDPDSFRSILNINLIAPLVLNQFFLEGMGSGSSILYVGSTLATKAVPGAASYCISKHAQVGMMRSTGQDLVGRNIHTAIICPGYTDTQMLRTHLNNDQKLIKEISSKVSFNRLISPDEIAKVLYFSANNPVISGSIIHSHLGQIEN